MSKKSIKLISALLTVALVVMMLTSTAFAINSPADLKGDSTNVTNAANSIYGVGNKLISIIQSAGMVVAVIILMVLGIKYMMGSSEEKASYKKTMMPYLIGAILLFGASALAGAVFDFAGSL